VGLGRGVAIEKYPCNDSNEARSRERYWIEKNQCHNMNSQTAQRTTAELQNEIYICDCGKELRYSRKAYHKTTKVHQDYLNRE
jgi:hypothetical protein